MQRRREWQPLLGGELAACAAEAVEEAARALAAGAPASAAEAVSLAAGCPGRALLFGYLDEVDPSRGHDERVRRSTNEH